MKLIKMFAMTFAIVSMVYTLALCLGYGIACLIIHGRFVPLR